MCWFSASLLFRSVHNGIASDDDLWEERIVLINADSEENANKECLRIGKSEEHEYLVSSDSSVRWRFIQVERVCEIDGDIMVDGLEVFSRYLRNSEVESILTPFD